MSRSFEIKSFSRLCREAGVGIQFCNAFLSVLTSSSGVVLFDGVKNSHGRLAYQNQFLLVWLGRLLLMQLVVLRELQGVRRTNCRCGKEGLI